MNIPSGKMVSITEMIAGGGYEDVVRFLRVVEKGIPASTSTSNGFLYKNSYFFLGEVLPGDEIKPDEKH